MKNTKETKEIKINPTIFYVVSAVLNIVGVITLATGGGEDISGIFWICLGSTFLCLGSALKSRENADKEKKDETDT